MSWFIGKENRTFLVEDDGTVWSVNKVIQYDPITLLPISAIETKTEVTTTELFKCDVCGREFEEKRYLGNHMRSHKE